VTRFRSGIANESVSGRDINDRGKALHSETAFWDGDRLSLERQAARYPSDFL
jgi:hypothetical protein